MIIKNSEFKHDENTLQAAIGIPAEVRNRCRERIFFCAFANHLQIQELFEDPDDAPKNMTTSSGDLERTLSIINNQEEYEYTLFSFINTHDLAKMAISYHKFITDNSTNKSERIKMKIIAMAAEVKMADELKSKNMDDDEESIISPNELIKRIPLVKNSHYNFDTYFNMIKSMKNSSKDDDFEAGSDFDIDSFLKDILD